MRPHKIDETWYQRPPGVPAHVAAGGIVARVDHQRVYIALVGQRGRAKYVLPKGHVEPGESVEQAARREIAEEAGVSQLTLVAPLGIKERLDFSKRNLKQTHYFLFTTEQVDGVPTDGQDYTVKWFALDELPELFWPEQAQLLRDHRQRLAELAAPAK